jgi:RimJ/RimL family protein N-acetyltransferase
MSATHIDGMGDVSIRAVDNDHPRPTSASTWDDWGEMDPAAKDMDLRRWVIEVTDDAGTCVTVGDLSAHAVWYGPTPGSRALNVGISLLEDHRGQGIGAIAQRLLAEELHAGGTVRVEASTDVENIAEQRALAKAGYLLEGVLRLAQARRDGLHDLQVWAHVRAPHSG